MENVPVAFSHVCNVNTSVLGSFTNWKRSYQFLYFKIAGTNSNVDVISSVYSFVFKTAFIWYSPLSEQLRIVFATLSVMFTQFISEKSPLFTFR